MGNHNIDFSDIAPISDQNFHHEMAQLVEEPLFQHAVKWVLPSIDWEEFKQKLLSIHSKREFILNIMAPFLELLASKTTHGITSGGLVNMDHEKSYTFITNHRDIVLDAAYLNLVLVRNNFNLTEVAIGDNLLIYPWITTLVKLNNSFIVRRGLKMFEALEAAKHLSSYIHHTVCDNHISVWIAHREGRAKDSNDRTQEGLVKMLGMNQGEPMRQNLMDINLMPVSITYEYDPNDYLKATEFLMRRRDPEFKKSKRDDLISMETGLLSQKGRVHFEFSPYITPEISQIQTTNRLELVRQVCGLIDRSIHMGYKIHEGNYVAYDLINGTHKFSHLYTEADVDKFENYIESQLEKVELKDVESEEREYMRMKMLEMYANPLINKMKVSQPFAYTE